MEEFKPKDYQLDIIKQTLNSNKSTLIQLPTGGGKTHIAKEIIQHLVEKLNKQVLFVAPKIILMEQTAEVFKGLNPYKLHGTNTSNKDYKVLVSTNQTASKRVIKPDIIIIDEVHYGYEGKMIQNLIKDNPNARIIGLSATPYDKDGKQLKGFELILDKYDLKYMVENKYLVNIKCQVLVRITKLGTVKITAGDYNQQELSKIVSNNQTILEIVGSTAEYISKYKKTIVFAVDIGHAELLTKAYQDEGFAAKVIHSKLSQEEQKIEIKNFKNGQTKILVSVAMLTTGFNVPDADVAVIARPTKSQNLYKQMVGRVLRIADNKTHALLLDCGNVIENLGEPLDPIKAKQMKEIVDNRQKCELCESKNLKLKYKEEKSFWECEDCGHIKDIKYGSYECKLCGKSYTHDAKFSQKSNKLWLNCDVCPYPTLISEYTGSEIFVQVGNKKYEKTTSNKSLVRILEEERKKNENSKNISKKNGDRINMHQLEEIRQKEQHDARIRKNKISRSEDERKKIIADKLKKLEKGHWGKKEIEEEKIRKKNEEKEELKNEEIKNNIRKKNDKINKDILGYFEKSLKERLNSHLQSGKRNQERINIFKKRIFKDFEQYQIDIVNASFNLENFIEVCSAELGINIEQEETVNLPV
ncbi:DEAD/DEAH box helicase [bacterium]|nr:DEAD/DEAH box helicase [bacterium]MBU1994141.1 DEAD/DEAH box helicase [bacterium]